MKKLFLISLMSFAYAVSGYAVELHCEDTNFNSLEGLKAKFLVNLAQDLGNAQIDLKSPLKFQSVKRTGRYRNEKLSLFDLLSGGGQSQPQSFEVTRKKRTTLLNPSNLKGTVSVENNQIIIRSESLTIKLTPRKLWDNNWYLPCQNVNVEHTDSAGVTVTGEVFCRQYYTGQITPNFGSSAK